MRRRTTESGLPMDRGSTIGNGTGDSQRRSSVRGGITVRALAVLSIAGFLGACASSPVSTPAATGTTPAAGATASLSTITPTPTAASTPEAVVRVTVGPPVAVPGSPAAEATIVGRAVCKQTVYATSAGPGQWRNSEIVCEVSSADARVAGTQTVEVNVNVLSDASAFLWGSARLVTDAGSWEGRYAAFAEASYPEGTHHVGAVLSGSGGYAGLRLSETMTTGPTGEDYEVLAWIEPAS